MSNPDTPPLETPSLEAHSPHQQQLMANWELLCAELETHYALPEGFLEAITKLYGLLLETNAHTNLTRITDLEGFYTRHILESLLFVPELLKKQAKKQAKIKSSTLRVMDIGSGGGFPVLPLALALPQISFMAVEATGKKCAYLNQVKTLLALDNLTILQARAEVIGAFIDPKKAKKQAPSKSRVNFREQADVLTARAVAPLPVLLELALPLLKTGGTLLALKGPAWVEEKEASQNALGVLGGQCQSHPLILNLVPALAHCHLLAVTKQRITPRDYPRAGGLITKNPL